ncbi:MAG: sugar ABC transporter permease [Lachnospiraceae bacterium]|nr:sugar ABC transporter permease [Lachnospiraceae bacterium]
MISKSKKKNVWNALIFLGPMILLFVIIKILPLILGAMYSFTNWNGISSDYDFIGIQNYITMFQDSQTWTSIKFTLLYVIVRVVLINVLGFFLAYCLCKKLKGVNFLRASFYIPNVIGGLILGFIWKFIFLQTFPQIAEATGIKFFALSWLGTEATAFWGTIIVDIWQNLGYMMVIYIAGLMAVSRDYMEAASIDGANSFQTLRHILIPLVMPAITQCLFMSTLNAFKIYDLNVSLTGGGPYRTSEAFTMNIYNTAFTSRQMGLGAAKSILFILMIVVITEVQVNLTRRKEVQM